MAIPEGDISRALLLNAGYEPLRVVTWQRAFILFYQGKVDVLEEYNESVHSITKQFNIPAVIRLRRWVKFPHRAPVVRFTRANIYARDRYYCQYCQKRFLERVLTLDHVVPVSRGGDKTWENIVTACLPCNQKKGCRTPKEAKLTLMKVPKKPRGIPGLLALFPLRRVSPIWDPYLPESWKVSEL